MIVSFFFNQVPISGSLIIFARSPLLVLCRFLWAVSVQPAFIGVLNFSDEMNRVPLDMSKLVKVEELMAGKLDHLSSCIFSCSLVRRTFFNIIITIIIILAGFMQ